MINKEDCYKLLNDYIELKPDFTIEAHKKVHPVLVSASKAWHVAKAYNMSTMRFSLEYMHYGQYLPRACGKSVFIKELKTFLESKGFGELPSRGRGVLLMHNGATLVILISDPTNTTPKHIEDSIKGFRLKNPPLILEYTTPVW